jgi:nucleoporin NDC1
MNSLIKNEVLVWRLAGAAVWQALAVTLVYITYNAIKNPLIALSPLRALGSIFHLNNWISVVTLLLTLAPAAAAYTAVMCTVEVAPKYRAGLNFLPPQFAALLRKVSARASSPQAAATWIIFLIGHIVSALAFFYHTLPSKINITSYQIMWQAIALALVYQAHVFFYSRDILTFPSIQRHRYFRIKQQLPSTFPHAAFLGISSYLLGSLLSTLTGRGLPTVGSAFPVITASTLCLLCWLIGTIAFEVVFTERLRPGDYGMTDCLKAMEVCLDGRNGVLMQDFALFDLSLVATDVGKSSWRREEIFADDSGGRWRPVASYCMGTISQIAESLAVALPKKGVGSAMTTTSSSAAAAAASTKWNTVPSALVKGMPVTQRQNLDALSAVSCQYQRGKFAIRLLCDVAVASLTEDRFGVVQLVQPTLGDIALQLLCMLLAIQQLLKQLGSGSAGRSCSRQLWRGIGDVLYTESDAHAALHAFHDELRTGLYHVTGEFGPALKEALVKATVVPPYGSIAEAGILLDTFFSGAQ